MPTPLAYPEPQSALSLWAVAANVAPPSEHVVAAVQMFGDIDDEREDGTILRRFSAARLERSDMRLLLGDETARAAQVSIVWDEREDQLLRVLDAAPLMPNARPRQAQPTGNRYADARMRGTTRGEFGGRLVAA